MTLEARVRTVEAMEATVCVDALALLSIPKSFSFSAAVAAIDIRRFVCICRFARVQMKNAKIPTAIKPPITAPAIAPGETPDPPDVAIVLQITAAHETQLCAVSSHRWLEEQLQTGVSVGQPCTHEESRANMSDPGTAATLRASAKFNITTTETVVGEKRAMA
jgi:hypothetical protein